MTDQDWPVVLSILDVADDDTMWRDWYTMLHINGEVFADAQEADEALARLHVEKRSIETVYWERAWTEDGRKTTAAWLLPGPGPTSTEPGSNQEKRASLSVTCGLWWSSPPKKSGNA